MPHLSALYCYPVKSCRGVALDETVLDRRGILHDRAFLIVDGENRFMTQRAMPSLARVETALSSDALSLTAKAAGEFRVLWSAPGRDTRHVTIWRDSVAARDCGDEVANWLSDVLGQRCRLVTMDDGSRRDLPAARIPEVHRAALNQPVPVAFSDAFPLLVISEESLADLNQRVGGDPPLSMDRFRPNLVLADCPAPYAEDKWQTYRVGPIRLYSAGGCGRCVVTTTNQQTLERTNEPLRTLAGYKRGAGGEVMFGQNVIHTQPGERLRVGDTVVPEA